MSVLRIGTRGSALALTQAEYVKALLAERSPGLETEITVVRVSGDTPPEDHEDPGTQSAGATTDAVSTGDFPDHPIAPTSTTEPATTAGGEDKRRWVDVIEDALLSGAIDLAVHSAKDVPGELADGLELLGAPP